jgi:hypothetical protein
MTPCRPLKMLDIPGFEVIIFSKELGSGKRGLRLGGGVNPSPPE